MHRHHVTRGAKHQTPAGHRTALNLSAYRLNIRLEAKALHVGNVKIRQAAQHKAAPWPSHAILFSAASLVKVLVAALRAEIARWRVAAHAPHQPCEHAQHRGADQQNTFLPSTAVAVNAETDAETAVMDNINAELEASAVGDVEAEMATFLSGPADAAAAAVGEVVAEAEADAVAEATAEAGAQAASSAVLAGGGADML